MLYLDTSLLAAYYCPEALSEKAEKIITSEPQPSISCLTEVEFVSVVSRKVRQRTLDRPDGERLIVQFLSHLEGHFYHRIRLEYPHYRLARDYLGRFTLPLRSLDALHLALAASEGATLGTMDRGLAKSARGLGINTVLVT